MTSIKKKLILMVLVPLVTLAIVTTAFISLSANRYLTNRTIDDLLYKSEMEVHRLEKTLTEIQSSVNVLADYTGLHFSLQRYQNNGDSYLKNYRNEIAPMIKKTVSQTTNCKGGYFIFSPDIGSIPSQVWFNFNNQIEGYERIIEYPNPGDFDSKNSNMSYYYKTLNLKKNIWSDPYIDLEIKEAIVSYTAPVWSEDKIIGIVGIDISIESIKNELQRFRYLDEGYAFMLDSKANIIYHPQFPLGYPLMDIEGMEPEGMYDELFSNNKRFTSSYTFQGDKKRLGYYRMENNWLISIAVKEKDIYKPIHRIQMVIILINTIALLAVIITSLTIASSTINPLQLFTNEIQKSKNNYNTILTEPKLLDRRDEIGDMSKAFLELQKTNKDVMERIIQDNISLERLAKLGEQVSSFTHELKTPIGVMLTGLSCMKEILIELESVLKSNHLEKSFLDNSLSQLIDINNLCLDNNHHSNRIISNFKKTSVSDSDIQLENMRLEALLNTVIKDFSISKSEPHIDYELNVPEKLVIKTYSGYLRQVFANLVSNSLKHGFWKMKTGKIIINCSVNNNSLSIDYSDNGRGIPEQYQSSLFKPYFTSAKDRGGTGLGLHIVQVILNDYLKGSIELINKIDPGILFRITLPVDPDKE